MTKEQSHKEKMLHYVEQSIESLESAMNVLECDDNFNNGQSNILNDMYEKIINSVELLKNIK